MSRALVPGPDRQALEQFRADVAAGKDWFESLLQAMALWASGQETVQDRQHVYLIAGEAFDWLALARRLLQDVDGGVPEPEREALLKYGQPPRALPASEFRRLIGPAKYRAYLNYFYGVTVEHALQQAVTAEVRKERHSHGLVGDRGVEREAFRRIYGQERTALATQFRQQGGKAPAAAGRKAFLYWLFKYRLAQCEQARVASDTKKGLRYLDQRGWEEPVESAMTEEPGLRREPGPGLA